MQRGKNDGKSFRIHFSEGESYLSFVEFKNLSIEKEK